MGGAIGWFRAALPVTVHGSRDGGSVEALVRRPRAGRRGFCGEQLLILAAQIVVRDEVLPDHDEAAGRSARRWSRRAAASHSRAARIRQLLHGILERVDFAAGDWSQTVRTQLQRAGYSSPGRPTPSSGCVKRADPLPAVSGWRTSRRRRRSGNCRFTSPAEFSPKQLVAGAAPWHRGVRLARGVARYLTGFMDWLAGTASAGSSPTTSQLAGARARAYAAPGWRARWRSRLYLQYLLYTVALHRWLATGCRYDYDRHFGGVRYCSCAACTGLARRAGEPLACSRSAGTHAGRGLDRCLGTPVPKERAA